METRVGAGGDLEAGVEGGEGWLMVRRPAKRNALTEAMWRAIPELIGFLVERGARSVVVRGAGGVFAAGADIAEFEVVYASRERAGLYSQAIARAVEALAACPIPTIAQIEGACVGGGVALALACDLRMAAPDARLGVTPARLGLMYTLSDTRRLAQAVGLSAAKDLLFTGRLVDAAEALALGLVDSISDDVATAVAEKRAQIAAASPWSQARTKAVMRKIEQGVGEDDVDSRAWFLDAFEGPDFQEGRAAFLARRPPRFRPD